MSTLVLEQSDVSGKLEDAENEPPKAGNVPRRVFYSFLTLEILSSRYLKTYCTPCQARGSAFS